MNIEDMTDWILVARYLAGECTPAEVEAVRQWAAAAPANATELAMLRRAWVRAGELPSAPQIEAMWERVAEGVTGAPRGRHSFSEGRMPAARSADRAPMRERVLSLAARSSARSWRTGALAAAAVIMALAGVVAVHDGVGTRRAPTETESLGAREYRTARGQRATIVLLDGTHVVLGVDSRLRVAASTAGRRELFLDGEAVFDVVHDTTRPFIVHASAAVARDNGTTFGVRAYPGESVRIVVESGSVAVRDTARPGAPPAILSAREMARVAGGAITVQRGIDPRPYLSWTSGQLAFDHVPLATVATQLDRWFDVRVTIEGDALGRADVNAMFDDDSLDAVLQTLAASLDVHVERNGREVVLRARR